MKPWQIIFSLLLPALAGCRSQPSPPAAAKAQHVEVTVLRREKVPQVIAATGTLASKTQSTLGFLTGGMIDRIYVHEGESVSANQLLARLDMTEIESKLTQARLALEKAKRDFDRAENLYRDSVATLEQYQNARTALGVARTNYNIARFNRKFSEIRAPSGGKILKRVAEEHEIVGRGYPVFIFAGTDAGWVLKVSLSDRDVVQTAFGDTARIRFDAYPGDEFRALVSQISDAADLMTGTYEVELRLDSLPPRLVSGLIGRARIETGARAGVMVPVEALAEADGMEGYVFRIENGRPKRVKLSVQRITGRGILPDSGSVRAGDTLVTEGSAYIREGMAVVIDGGS